MSDLRLGDHSLLSDTLRLLSPLVLMTMLIRLYTATAIIQCIEHHFMTISGSASMFALFCFGDTRDSFLAEVHTDCKSSHGAP